MDCLQDTSGTGLESPKQTKTDIYFENSILQDWNLLTQQKEILKIYQIPDHDLKRKIFYKKNFYTKMNLKSLQNLKKILVKSPA